MRRIEWSAETQLLRAGLSGDGAFLRALWPKVRQALEFCWVPGGWGKPFAGSLLFRPQLSDRCLIDSFHRALSQ